MDSIKFSDEVKHAQENNIPIKVFNIKSSGHLYEIIMGSNIGTKIGK